MMWVHSRWSNSNLFGNQTLIITSCLTTGFIIQHKKVLHLLKHIFTAHPHLRYKYICLYISFLRGRGGGDDFSLVIIVKSIFFTFFTIKSFRTFCSIFLTFPCKKTYISLIRDHKTTFTCL